MAIRTSDDTSLSGIAVTGGLRGRRSLRAAALTLAGLAALGVLTGCGGGSSASTIRRMASAEALVR